MKNNSVIKCIATIIISVFFLAFIYDLSTEDMRNPAYCFLVICIAVSIIAFYDRLPKTPVLYTMLAGAFLRFTYVLYTPVWCRQHDVIDFGAGEGHAAYMEYILTNRSLPDFDPRNVWAFFQPPLHHIISAVWMWFNIKAGIPEGRMHKNVQILPLMYMCILMIMVLLICRQLNMRRGGTIVTMLIVSFHPIYILMSGSINNDALSVLLSVVAVYMAILWYMYPTTGKIILLALSIGLAMSAKLSSALVAPAIGAMMICKFWKDSAHCSDKAKTISYLLEFAAFAVVVIPTGLWWTVRNKVLYDMPAGYIPEVGEMVGKRGLVPTILDVRTASPFLYMKSCGYAYDEYNLILATIKSSLFGEGDFGGKSAMLTVTGWILLAFAVILLLLLIIAIVRVCMGHTGVDTAVKVLLCGTVVCYVAGYLMFALKGANLSAMDYRYSAASVAVMAIFAGMWYDMLRKNEKRAAAYAVMAVSGAFAAASFVFYTAVGIILQ